MPIHKIVILESASVIMKDLGTLVEAWPTNTYSSSNISHLIYSFTHSPHSIISTCY